MERLSGLPFGTEEEETFHGPLDHSRVAASPIKKRILIIDDEPLFGQTMSMLLGGQYEVTVERTGRGGLRRLLTERSFDLVLCDVSLPDIPGPALYDEVARCDAELCDRFVFVTGGAFNEMTREFLRRYQGPRLDKPFTLGDLERLVEAQTRLSA
jgi:two-component system, NtrC family, sensor kinase